MQFRKDMEVAVWKRKKEEEQEWAPKTKNKSIPNEEKRMNSDMGCSKRGDGES